MTDVNQGSSDQSDEVSDEEVAEAMRMLADGFIEGSDADGFPHFTWDVADAARLDAICDALRVRDDPQGDGWHGRIMTMGAYLGELLVRHGNGHWSYDSTNKAAVVIMPNGLAAYPHNKVAKRLEIGPEHSLSAFFDYSLSRHVPPGGQVRTMRDQ